MTVTLALTTIEAIALASVRIAAFLVIAPPFNHRGLSGQVKAMLAFGLALAAAPRVGTTDGMTTGDFVVALATNAVIGAGMGFIVLLIFSGISAAGSFIDFFGGFQIAQAYDPGSQVNGAQFTRLFQMTAIVLLFATGAYQVMLLGVAQSFDVVPVSAGLDLSFLGAKLTETITTMFVSALQIAGPLILVLFLADAGLGLVTRVAPALNAFVLGFPLKILLSLTFGVFVLLGLPGAVSSLTGKVLMSIADMLGVG